MRHLNYTNPISKLSLCKGGGRAGGGGAGGGGGGGNRAGAQFRNRPVAEQAQIINRMRTDGRGGGFAMAQRNELMNDMLERAGFQRETGREREIVIRNQDEGERAIRTLRNAGITGELPGTLDPDGWANSLEDYERLNRLFEPRRRN